MFLYYIWNSYDPLSNSFKDFSWFKDYMRRAKFGGHMVQKVGAPDISAGSDLKDIECSGLPAISVLQEGAASESCIFTVVKLKKVQDWPMIHHYIYIYVYTFQWSSMIFHHQLNWNNLTLTSYFQPGPSPMF